MEPIIRDNVAVALLTVGFAACCVVGARAARNWLLQYAIGDEGWILAEIVFWLGVSMAALVLVAVLVRFMGPPQ